MTGESPVIDVYNTGTGADQWKYFADSVFADESPLNSSLASAVAADPALLELIQTFPAHPHQPLIVLAAVQYLVMGGAKGPVASLYEHGSRAVPITEAGPLIGDFIRSHEADVRDLLTRWFIQTNEPTRSACIGLGVAWAARQIGEPIGLIDDGASAGLNLAFDRFRLDFGAGRELGALDSPVRLYCELRNLDVLPVDRLPTVAARIGIDRNPIDLRDEPSRRWLLALTWPGTARQRQLRQVIDLVRLDPPTVRRGDMVDDLGQALQDMNGRPTVVVTSWSFSYLRRVDRARFEQVLAQHGRSRPIAWVCCDGAGSSQLFRTSAPPPPDLRMPSLMGVAVFDGDSIEGQTLAYVDPYGSWLDWIDTAVCPDDLEPQNRTRLQGPE
jgi:hypothetical protein